MRRSQRAGAQRFRRLRSIRPKLRRLIRRAVPRAAPVSKAPRYPKAEWLGQTSNTSGPFKPGNCRFIVHHYTAGGSGLASAKYLHRPHSPSSSAHFVIDRDGKVYQICGIDLIAWHAGKSVWKGHVGLNSYSIGLEFANYGFLKKTNTPGKWLIAATNYKTAFVDHPFFDHDDVLEKAHKNGGPELGWEPYPEAQIQAGLELTKWLLGQIPTIREQVGHDDVSPGRKSDPGPAFPLDRFKALQAPPRPKSAEPAVAALGLAALPEDPLPEAESNMTGLNEPDTKLPGTFELEESNGIDEPFDPPRFNEGQALSLFRTLLQALGVALVSSGWLTQGQADSWVNVGIAVIGLALFIVPTLWGLSAQSTRNIIRRAKTLQRRRREDASEKL